MAGSGAISDRLRTIIDAADERAAGIPAAPRDARNDRRALFGIEPAGREIVEEE